MSNAFTDSAVEPTPELIADVLGPGADAWAELLRVLDDAGIAVAQKWYRDGGWLVRASKGSKTILWAAIDDEGFVDGAFHFAGRLREAVATTPGLSPHRAEAIREAPLAGNSFSVSFELRTPGDVDALRPILTAKLTLK